MQTRRFTEGDRVKAGDKFMAPSGRLYRVSKVHDSMIELSRIGTDKVIRCHIISVAHARWKIVIDPVDSLLDLV